MFFYSSLHIIRNIVRRYVAYSCGFNQHKAYYGRSKTLHTHTRCMFPTRSDFYRCIRTLGSCPMTITKTHMEKTRMCGTLNCPRSHCATELEINSKWLFQWSSSVQLPKTALAVTKISISKREISIIKRSPQFDQQN